MRYSNLILLGAINKGLQIDPIILLGVPSNSTHNNESMMPEACEREKLRKRHRGQRGESQGEGLLNLKGIIKRGRFGLFTF